MILKHKTTSEMVNKFLGIIKKRVAKSDNAKIWQRRNLESTL
jgi:hypothetical protein